MKKSEILREFSPYPSNYPFGCLILATLTVGVLCLCAAMLLGLVGLIFNSLLIIWIAATFLAIPVLLLLSACAWHWISIKIPPDNESNDQE